MQSRLRMGNFPSCREMTGAGDATGLIARVHRASAHGETASWVKPPSGSIWKMALSLTKADIRRLEEAHPRVSLQFHGLIAKRLCRRMRDKDRLTAGLVRGMKRPLV